MKRRAELLVLAALLPPALPTVVPAQQPASAPRVVTVSTEPERPEFGRVFELRLTLRLATSTTLVLPDTLADAEGARSVAPGSWELVPAPGDSTDVVAVYPLIGFQAGVVLLPDLEVRTAPSAEEAGVRVLGAAHPAGRDVLEGGAQHVLKLGGVASAPHAGMVDLDRGVDLRPHPPAGVSGGDRSVFWLLAVSLASLVGVGGAGAFLRGRGVGLVALLRGRSPRRQALRELDRIRALEWHRNGRIDDFYASSTDVVRLFAHHLDGSWAPALTSTELLRKIELQAGAERTAGLRTVIETSERVKFGGVRPSPEDAERDWAALRDWVRNASLL